ncbi:MAG: peptidylprolyl isomerase [Saprospiraceae bacterium]|nr:peptidylprolyl isomerase [Saprospiraceae bacterium]
MSITGTIRRNSWVLFILIGLGMLGFLLMDATSGQGGALTGGNQSYGKVKGQKVSPQDIQTRIDELANLYPNANDDQLFEAAWGEVLNQRVFYPKYESLGLEVSDVELAELIKSPNPHRFTRTMFNSIMEGGVWDANKVIEIIDNPKDYPNEQGLISQLEKSIRDDVLNTKYMNALRLGINAPEWATQEQYAKEVKTADFDYFMLPFSLIKDDEIEISDADIRKYAQANKGKYTAAAGAVFEYVSIPKLPSKTDTVNQMARMRDVKERFATEKNDSLFAISSTNIILNPTQGPINQNIGFQTRETLKFPEDQENLIFSADIGDIVGPFEYNGNAFLVKVLEKQNVPDSARIRHILIEAPANNPIAYAAARETADSLLNELKRDKSKFNDYVNQYSGDTNSVPDGGVYDYFPQGQMVPEFNAVSFYGEGIGDLQIASTIYGHHIVEPLGRKGRAQGVKVAVIGQGFRASKQTNDDIYRQAKEFEQNSQNAEDFEKNAEAFGGKKVTPSIEPEARFIPEIGAEPAVIRWANNAGIGEVKYFSLPTQTIIARLVNRTKAGELNVSGNEDAIRAEVLKEKKAALLNKQIEDAGGVTADFEGLAKKLNRNVQNAAEAKFGQSGNTIGFEPEIISKVFFLDPGDITQPLMGRRGVYVVKVNSFGQLPEESNLAQYSQRVTNRMLQKASPDAITQALKDKGIIKDDRYKFR